MELMTRIDIPASEWKMKAGAKVLLVGSCFADEIGEKMGPAMSTNSNVAGVYFSG